MVDSTIMMGTEYTERYWLSSSHILIVRYPNE